MSAARRLPAPPAVDSGWKRTGTTAYQRMIVAPHTHLIARAAQVERGAWTASVVLRASDGQRFVGLDDRRNTVDEAQRACEAVLEHVTKG